MSRVIKFRAYREWATGKGKMEYMPNSRLFQGLESGLLADNYTLMQYTGLRDKNGKEIYEGDILKWNDNYLEVKWGSVGWVLFSKLFSRFGFPDGKDCDETNTKGYTLNSEVIGNIYENKNLLEDNKDGN